MGIFLLVVGGLIGISILFLKGFDRISNRSSHTITKGINNSVLNNEKGR